MSKRLVAVAPFLALCTMAFAQEAEVTPPDTVNTLWIIISTILVLLMTPALALFYGGMVRKKNILSTMLHSFVLMGVVSIIWILVGYSLAFAPAPSGFFGNFDYAAANGVSEWVVYPALTIPIGVHMLFQMMFAIITAALISGAIAERMKFGGYVLFSALWSLLVYAPVACWVWNGEGWLFKHGALDFAGGTVVHLASGAAALACALALGKRKALVNKEPILPNNLTLTLLGAGLLWVGWIGFNAGSALAVDGVAVNAFITTQVAAAAGLVGWMLVEKARNGKATALGAASGIVAGLVGITPGAGFVEPLPAIVIGLVAGAACCLAISLKFKLGYDDALDVVGVHGVGGTLGAILTGVFASAEVNAVAEAALADGRGALVIKQIVAVGAVAAFSFVVSFIIMLIVKAVAGIRTSEAEEEQGLDLALHGEEGYNLG